MFVFKTAHCVAAHVAMLQLSCSICIQKKIIFLRVSFFAFMHHREYGAFSPRAALQYFTLYKFYFMSPSNDFYHKLFARETVTL